MTASKWTKSWWSYPRVEWANVKWVYKCHLQNLQLPVNPLVSF